MDILFLAHRVPFPPDRGDKIRSFNVLRYLAARARVHLVAFAEDAADLDPAVSFTTELASCTVLPRTKSRARAAMAALATGRPVSLTAFADPAMRRAVAATMASHSIDAVYCFSGQMAQYLPPDVRAVMDFVDVDSAKFTAFATTGSPFMRPLMRREGRLLAVYERDIAAKVEASTFVSDAEAALFRAGGGQGRVLTIENGIDACAFDPDVVEPVASPHPLVVFTGQMDYRPNVEAVIWFAADILPHLSDARFAIVGRAPTRAVQALASDRVIVTGAVPDVRGWLAAADVCVAPLKLARGIQNKVLEAMAMARPVVATSAAAEGIDHAGTIRLADDPAGFAAEVAALLGDRAAGMRLGAAARAQVLRRYDWAARLAPLDALLGLPAARQAA